MRSKQLKRVLYSTYILFILDDMVSKKYKTKGSYIKAKQLTTSMNDNDIVNVLGTEYKELQELTNRLWKDSVSFKEKDESLMLAAGELIECLALDTEDIFNQKEIDIFLAASTKLHNEAVPKQAIEDTRLVAKNLISNIDKAVDELVS